MNNWMTRGLLRDDDAGGSEYEDLQKQVGALTAELTALRKDRAENERELIGMRVDSALTELGIEGKHRSFLAKVIPADIFRDADGEFVGKAGAHRVTLKEFIRSEAKETAYLFAGGAEPATATGRISLLDQIKPGMDRAELQRITTRIANAQKAIKTQPITADEDALKDIRFGMSREETERVLQTMRVGLQPR
jgi:hypothetical protein